MSKVALWTWRHHSLCVEWFDSETEAADSAVSDEDQETGSTAGVQFADGTFVARNDWPEYEAASERRTALWEAEFAAERDKPPAPSWTINRPPGASGGGSVKTWERPPDGWPGVVGETLRNPETLTGDE